MVQPKAESLFATSEPMLPNPTIPTRFPPSCDWHMLVLNVSHKWL